jgi:glycosyltransferase involved in cell wall biosynthesis
MNYYKNKLISEKPFVTVIIPCLNEKDYISKCLDSVIASDYPKERLEILVMDGLSEDETRIILERYANTYSYIKVFDNHKKITPAALNIGVRNAKGEIIVRMDAHSTYEKDYISQCVKYLKEYNADNVGGMWITVPRNNSLSEKAIAFALSHSFGVGNAHYRIGWAKEPMWVDTVPYGCYHKKLFNEIGLFNENFPRNEDTEFNARLRKAGGKILLVPDIKVYYYVRSAFYKFCKHIFDNGFKVAEHLKLNETIFSWRHFIPLIFVLSLISFAILSFLFPGFLYLSLLIFGSYMVINFYFSGRISFKQKDIRYLLLMPIIFISLHFTYGLGTLWGLLRTWGRMAVILKKGDSL